MPEESNKGWHCKKGVKLKFVCCCCSTKIACPVWPWGALLLVWASGFFQFGQFIAPKKQGWTPTNGKCSSVVIIVWLEQQNGPIVVLLLRHVVCEMMGCDYQIWHSFSSVCGLAKAASMMCCCRALYLQTYSAFTQAGQSPSSGWNWAVMVIRVGGAWERSRICIFPRKYESWPTTWTLSGTSINTLLESRSPYSAAARSTLFMMHKQ